ncbi:MAG: DNA-binding CsgD family transcriptional regulator [Bacteroidia bacterium]|jgi:DNA-binding CsgD family transcriptional regulator
MMHYGERIKLSKREIEVLLPVASGKRSIDIGDLLRISKHTVDNHRKNMLRKTGTSGSMQLVAWATKEGLLV